LLSLEDLFLAGLGFDVAGAILLGRSLLRSPREARVRTGMWLGFNALDLAGAARDRADATFGILGLVAGFAFQASAYATTLAGASPVERGAGRTGVGILILLAAVVAVAGLRTLFGWRVVMRGFVVAMARVWPDESEGNPLEGRADVSVLELVAAELGRSRLESEGGPAGARVYVRRVFGLHVGDVEFRDDYSDAETTETT
jgi:hypothetical protein